MKAPEHIETARLILRRPRRDDASAIFQRYSSDENVTRWLGWPRHKSIKDTEAFLSFSDAEWERSPAGPYLLEYKESGILIGGTGFSFETDYRATTGYVLSKDAWGKGYATEALHEIISIAAAFGVIRLYALCHPDNVASWRVLEKCGLSREGILRRYIEFPNLNHPGPQDVFCYSIIL